jgi:NADH:ubiquinone oxidoreductase subunit K
MTLSLSFCLYLTSALFAIGVYGVLSRQNLIVILMSLELMLNAVNLTLVAFGRAFLPNSAPQDANSAQIFVIIVLAVAAAEAGVGLSILLAVYRKWRTTNVGQIDMLKG